MGTKEKVIEELKWEDVFNGNVVSFTLVFIGILICFRLMVVLIRPQASKIFIYFLKATAYGSVVTMLCVYFSKYNDAENKINIFTGFTFLFSTIEVVDNIGLMLEEIIGQNVLNRNIDKKYFSKEEKRFTSFIYTLNNLYCSIAPGRVNAETKKYVTEVKKIYCDEKFFRIDSILSNITDSNNSLYNSIIKIITSDMFMKINSNEFKKIVKRETKSLSFNKNQCEEFKNILKETIKFEKLYYDEKSRLKKEKKNLDIVN